MSGNKDNCDTKSQVGFCCNSSCLLLLLQFWVARAAEKCQMSEAPIADLNLVSPELGTDILDCMSSSAQTAMCIWVLSSLLAEVGERLSGVDMVVDVGRRFERHVKVKNKWIACDIAQSTMTTNQLLFGRWIHTCCSKLSCLLNDLSHPS